MSVEKAIHLLRFWIYINILARACARPENLAEGADILQCVERNSGYYYRVASGHICCMCYPGSFRIGDCEIRYPNTTQCGTCRHNKLIQTFTSVANNYRSCNISKTELDCKALMYTRLQLGNNSMDNKCVCVDGTYAIDSEINGCKNYTKCAPGYGVERPGDATHDVVCRLCPAGTCSYKYSNTEMCTPTADPCNLTSTSGTFSEGDSMPIVEKSSLNVTMSKGSLAAICILPTLIFAGILIYIYSKFIKDSHLQGSSDPAPIPVDLKRTPDKVRAQPGNGHMQNLSGGDNQDESMRALLKSEETPQDTDPTIENETSLQESTIIENPEAPAASGNQAPRQSIDSTPSGDEVGAPSEGSATQVTEQDRPPDDNKTDPIPDDPDTSLASQHQQVSEDDQLFVSDEQFEEDLSIFDDLYRDQINVSRPTLHKALASEKYMERMCNHLVSEIETPTLKDFLRCFELVRPVRMGDIERENKDQSEMRMALLTAMRYQQGSDLDPRAIIQKARHYDKRKVYDELCQSFIDRLRE